MAPGDESNLIEAVVTCEGNLHDPDFSERFQILLGNLKTLLREDELVKVKKIEPWNSVRVTISIPKEAAQKLKQLAEQGSHVLKSLGILTVQVDGDQVISLTIAGQNNQPTELILRQDNNGSSSSSSSAQLQPLLQSFSSSSTSASSSSSSLAPSGPQLPLGILSPSPTTSAFIRSPNVVAPAGESIPNLPSTNKPNSSIQNFTPHSSSTRPPSLGLGGPFPFASMAHAAQTMQRTDHPIASSSSSAGGSLTLTPQTNTNSISVSVSSGNNNNINNNNYVNHHHYAVNSTNSSAAVSSSSSSSTATVATVSLSSLNSSSITTNQPVATTFSSMFTQHHHHQTQTSSSSSATNVASNTSAVLQQQQQQQQQVGGLFKSELNQFVQLQGMGGGNNSPSLTNQLLLPTTSQSLQQNVNPPPYPGVNSGSSTSNSSNLLLNPSSTSSSGNLVNVNNPNQQQQNFNNVNLLPTPGNNNNQTSLHQSTPRSSFVGAPHTRPSLQPSISSSNNVTLSRSISSPAMTSTTTTLNNNQNQNNNNQSSFMTSTTMEGSGSSSSFKDFLGSYSSSTSQYQQPMSSPLLVNLLQNSEALGGGSSSGQGHQQQQQGIANILFPPGSSLEHKKLILAQHMQQRKAKRGLSLEGASSTFGEILSGDTGNNNNNHNNTINSGVGIGGTMDRASPSSSSTATSQQNNSSLTQITLPSTFSSSSSTTTSFISTPSESSQTTHPLPTSTRMNVPPISVGQPRPSSDLSTTATIIQGRTIIHQGSVRVFNPGQIRAIRFNQTSPTTDSAGSSSSTSGPSSSNNNSSSTVVGGEDVGVGLGLGAVQLLNGPSSSYASDNMNSPSPLVQHQSSASTAMSIGEGGMVKIEPASSVNNVVYSADQSSRTFTDNLLNMNVNDTTTLSSVNVSSSSSLNSNSVSHNNNSTTTTTTTSSLLSNVIPPSEPPAAASASNVPTNFLVNNNAPPMTTTTTNHMRLSTPKSNKFQERQAAFSAVQSHEAKLFPTSQHLHQQFLLQQQQQQQQQKGLKQGSNKPSSTAISASSSGGKPRQLLNPLTGVMEPSLSGCSSDSGEDEKDSSLKKKTKKGGGRKALGGRGASSATQVGGIQHRQIVTTTTTGVTVARVLKSSSDSHNKIVAEERKQQLLQNRLTVVPVTISSSSSSSSPSSLSAFSNFAQGSAPGRKSSRDEGGAGVELGLATITSKDVNNIPQPHAHYSPAENVKKGGEKIKLRLKLEKNEPISPAYKVDVSFVKKSEKGALLNQPSSSSFLPTTASSTGASSSSSSMTSSTMTNASSTTTSSSSAAGSHVNNPTEQPRVPPLHISLRGKNAAVVVSSPRREDDLFSSSSSPTPSYLSDGGIMMMNKPLQSSTAASSAGGLLLERKGSGGGTGKRTKNRIKSSGIESDSSDQQQHRHLKVSKLSRPRLSKDSNSNTSIISLSELDGFVTDSLKSRLIDFPSTSSPSSPSAMFGGGKPPLTIGSSSSSTTILHKNNNNSSNDASVKDLIILSDSRTTLGSSSSSGSIPSSPPTVAKLKQSGRRASDSELKIIDQQQLLQQASTTDDYRSVVESGSENPANLSPLDSSSSSLLFQHLSKKEDNSMIGGTTTSSIAHHQQSTSSSSSSMSSSSSSSSGVTHVSMSTATTNISTTSTTKSVLTLTSTATGATISTAKGISETDVVRITTVPSTPLTSSTTTTVSDGTFSSLPAVIPTLGRENIPKPLDISGTTRMMSSAEESLINKSSLTPMSKSPNKPLPELLALSESTTTTTNNSPPPSLTPLAFIPTTPPLSSSSEILTPSSTIKSQPPNFIPPAETKLEQLVEQQKSSIKPKSDDAYDEGVASTTTIFSSSVSEHKPTETGGVYPLDDQPLILASSSSLTTNAPPIHKQSLTPLSTTTSSYPKPKLGSPTPVLRPKKQTPKVSIGTSIDSELPSLVPSPSLRELLEKEREQSLVSSSSSSSLLVGKDGQIFPKNSIEINKMVASKLSEIVQPNKSSPEVVNPIIVERSSTQPKVVNLKTESCEELSVVKSSCSTTGLTTTTSESSSSPSSLENRGVDPILEQKEEKSLNIVMPLIPDKVSDVEDREQQQQGTVMVEENEPFPSKSTVTPNAPLPFPLIVPTTGEDQPGVVPGEDSGIDSMDALSEKSPNQGESPVRKEIEQFGESSGHHHHSLSTTCVTLSSSSAAATATPSTLTSSHKLMDSAAVERIPSNINPDNIASSAERIPTLKTEVRLNPSSASSSASHPNPALLPKGDVVIIPSASLPSSQGIQQVPSFPPPHSYNPENKIIITTKEVPNTIQTPVDAKTRGTEQKAEEKLFETKVVNKLVEDGLTTLNKPTNQIPNVPNPKPGQNEIKILDTNFKEAESTLPLSTKCNQLRGEEFKEDHLQVGKKPSSLIEDEAEQQQMEKIESCSKTSFVATPSNSTIMSNHINVIQELNQKVSPPQLMIPKPSTIVHNAKFRRAKLENIVAAIGTKNIERQLIKPDGFGLDYQQAEHPVNIAQEDEESMPNLLKKQQTPLQNELSLTDVVEDINTKNVKGVSDPGEEKANALPPGIEKEGTLIKGAMSHHPPTLHEENPLSLTKKLVEQEATKASSSLLLPPILETEESHHPPNISPAVIDTNPPTLISSSEASLSSSVTEMYSSPSVSSSSAYPPKLDLPDLAATHFSSKPPLISAAAGGDDDFSLTSPSSSGSRPKSPEKPILEPQTLASTLKPRPKVNRRGQDKPPKLSKATETDPRPECANPPHLEMGASHKLPPHTSIDVPSSRVMDEVVPTAAVSTLAISPEISPPEVINNPSNLIHQQTEIDPTLSRIEPPAPSISLGAASTTTILPPSSQIRSIPSNNNNNNMMQQLSKAIPIPVNAIISPQTVSSPPLQSSVSSSSNTGTTTSILAGQTVFAIHPTNSNVNLASNLLSHQFQSINPIGQSSSSAAITGVLSGGQKIPVKLVTIPSSSKTTSTPTQFQTIPLSTGLGSQNLRGSPNNILEAVNIVTTANAGSRSNSPKTMIGGNNNNNNNPMLQTTPSTTIGGPINLATVTALSSGGGNIQLVPISMSSTVVSGSGGGSIINPVKVLVSQPVKLNQSSPHHNMIMKSVMMGQSSTASTTTATIRVMRPAAEGGGIQDIEVVTTNPELLQTLQNSTATLSVSQPVLHRPQATTLATPAAELINLPPTTTTNVKTLLPAAQPPKSTIIGDQQQKKKLEEVENKTQIKSSPPSISIISPVPEKATALPSSQTLPLLSVTKVTSTPSSSSPPKKTTGGELLSPVESSQQKLLHKRVDDLEVLEPELNQINDDDLPLEADIIHDLKDLEDVLAGESIDAQENGIDSPYDFTIEEKLPEKYQGGFRKHNQQQDNNNKDSSLPLNTGNKVVGGGSMIKKQIKGVEPPPQQQQQPPKLLPPPTTNSADDDVASAADVNSSPDSPIPVIRSSSPLYTYGNRSSSNKTSRSPSPTDESSDIHGEDQEIIDSFARSPLRSPSQPKLSPQNNNSPRRQEEDDDDDDLEEATGDGDLEGHHHHKKRKSSPIKPNLTNSSFVEASNRNNALDQLSIEIPPAVDLLLPAEHNTPTTTEEQQRKPTRSTRSNTRLVSPDITAFRSDTPKPIKFSTKPDPQSLRNSPKPSPTGSFKMLSPTVSSGLTPSSSNRSSPISLPGSNSTNHHASANSVTAAALERLGGHLSNHTSVGSAGGKSSSSSSHNKATTTTTSSKRKRQESDSSSNASKDENNEEKIEIDLNSRPGKRRCSENAAELIKVCIGVEDTPKRNSMLIKRMEESNKLKEAKLKKAMATLVEQEEKEDDTESVESVLSRGRGGRSSRASSEDRSSSRGSSVQRASIGSSSKALKEDELMSNHEQKTTSSKTNSRPPKDKGQKDTMTNQNSTSTKKTKEMSNSSGAKRVASNRNLATSTKEKSSPLTPAKTRTNVGKGNTTTSSSNVTHGSSGSSQQTPESENSRRKTRSTAASKRYGEASDSELAALKRRRISKDTKS